MSKNSTGIMSNKPFAIVFRIWIIALFINTIAGTIMVGTIETHFRYLGEIFIYGGVLGALVSLPALVIMYIAISYCRAWKVKLRKLFVIVILSAAAMATIAWILYVECLGGHYREIHFLLLALFAGITATASQYRSFQYMTQYEEEPLFEMI